MGHRVDDVLLKAIIQEVDADGESLQWFVFESLSMSISLKSIDEMWM
jgi:hypothetical protein